MIPKTESEAKKKVGGGCEWLGKGEFGKAGSAHTSHGATRASHASVEGIVLVAPERKE